MVVLTLVRIGILLLLAGIIITQIIYPVIVNKPLFGYFRNKPDIDAINIKMLKGNIKILNGIIDKAEKQLKDINSGAQKDLEDIDKQKEHLELILNASKEELNRITKNK